VLMVFAHSQTGGETPSGCVDGVRRPYVLRAHVHQYMCLYSV
jgi:hypothetical protein